AKKNGFDIAKISIRDETPDKRSEVNQRDETPHDVGPYSCIKPFATSFCIDHVKKQNTNHEIVSKPFPHFSKKQNVQCSWMSALANWLGGNRLWLTHTIVLV